MDSSRRSLFPEFTLTIVGVEIIYYYWHMMEGLIFIYSRVFLGQIEWELGYSSPQTTTQEQQGKLMEVQKYYSTHHKLRNIFATIAAVNMVQNAFAPASKIVKSQINFAHLQISCTLVQYFLTNVLYIFLAQTQVHNYSCLNLLRWISSSVFRFQVTIFAHSPFYTKCTVKCFAKVSWASVEAVGGANININ